ncbi:hypothetical protein ABEH45_003594 [Yersinia enterocolitica]
MTSAIEKLKSRLLPYREKNEAPVVGHPFTYLQRIISQLERKVDARAVQMVPPKEKRRQAISRLRSGDMPQPSEWKMIFFGLNDVAEGDLFDTALIDDAANFAKISAEIQSKIAQQRLTRREWLALCTSYFGHASDTPEENPQWLQLRMQIVSGFKQLKESSPRLLSWMTVIDTYGDIFTDKAGFLLGQQLGRGEITDISVLEKVAQIPQTSWLWRKIVNHLVSEIFRQTDDEFEQKINELIALSRQFPRFKDNLLAAMLTRYYHSVYKQKTHLELKQIALEYWGNPQLIARNKGWLLHVEKPVLLMVQSWFAKDDLKLFFELLKGNRDVDEARLFYWLRYTNQMSYTRIVLGTDSQESKDPAYVEFRKKNARRLSQLTGTGARDNNAIIMQIGDYLFVEYSKVGAVYPYHHAKAPFEPEKQTLNIERELKSMSKTVGERLMHRSPVNDWEHNPIHGWMKNFDDALNRLGIYYQEEDTALVNPGSVDYSRFEAKSLTATPATEPVIEPVNVPEPALGIEPKVPPKQVLSSLAASVLERHQRNDVKAKEERLNIIAKSQTARQAREAELSREQQIKEIIRSAGCKVEDRRGMGGVLHIQFLTPNYDATKELLRLGFKPVSGKYLRYWSK